MVDPGKDKGYSASQSGFGDPAICQPDLTPFFGNSSKKRLLRGYRHVILTENI